MQLSVKERESWNAQAESDQRNWIEYVLRDFQDTDIAVTGHGLVGYALGRKRMSGELDVKSLAALAIAGGHGLRRPEVRMGVDV